ncbi:MAG: FkbM family methyltransferase [Jatrophihabitans sp.]
MAELTHLFFRLVRVTEPDLFIEAGAKEASTSLRIRRYLPTARVVAFEANPFTYEKFGALHDFAAANVDYRHLALSDRPGSVTFHVNHNDAGMPQADGQGSLLRSHEASNGLTEVTVEATTLDSFFADHTFQRGALWIDVEGAAKEVLSGAVGTVGKADVAIIEVEDRAYWGQEWLFPEVSSYFFDRGMIPIARDFQSRYQYNVIYVSEAVFHRDRVRLELALHHARAAGGRRPEPESVRAQRENPVPPSRPAFTTSQKRMHRARSSAGRVVRGRRR